MTENEKTLLVALANMVDQYLDSYRGSVDPQAVSAAEHAVRALADFGMMKVLSSREAQWTDAGSKLLVEARSTILKDIGLEDISSQTKRAGVITLKPRDG
ncbi:hypothetical protein JQ633_10920 [Bradyrhizobium tropiciagri]|uniref:hypothetical protein n=1 Tax=Bradyrhizobium tropiciagri TaxID=312253 RepID=UPI001BA92229|nr:hypothetical protein [Bradyrhizobium tropiciagri]MBR0870870.1 hypothetical protein [Bradyrhizobium tropiciagri]